MIRQTIGSIDADRLLAALKAANDVLVEQSAVIAAKDAALRGAADTIAEVRGEIAALIDSCLFGPDTVNQLRWIALALAQLGELARAALALTPAGRVAEVCSYCDGRGGIYGHDPDCAGVPECLCTGDNWTDCPKCRPRAGRVAEAQRAVVVQARRWKEAFEAESVGAITESELARIGNALADAVEALDAAGREAGE